MKKKLAIMAIAACVATASVAGVSQSVDAAPKLKLASELETEESAEEDEAETEEEAEETEAEETEESEDEAEEAAETEDETAESDDESAAEDEAEEDGAETEETQEEAEAEDAAEEVSEDEEASAVGIAEDATISVTGTGSSSITPDGAVLYVGVETSAESSKEAQSGNAETINAVIEALVDAGVEEKDITTSSFDIYSDYDYVDGSSVFAGYRVSTMLTVSNLEIDMVGDLIDLAVDAGANDIDGISYTYSDAEEAYDQALEAAIDRAYAKAELLAGKAGGTLEVVSIEEEEYSYSTIDARSYSVTTLEAADEDSDSMTVLAGETEITATVNVVFRLVDGEDETEAVPEENPDGEAQNPEEPSHREHGPEARAYDDPQIEEEYGDTPGEEPQDETEEDVNADEEETDGSEDEEAGDGDAEETTDIEETAATKETDSGEDAQEDGEE